MLILIQTIYLFIAVNRYQLFIDDQLEDNVTSFGNEWKLDLFLKTDRELPKLFLGAVGDNEKGGTSYFKGCMKNFAIQFRSARFINRSVLIHGYRSISFLGFTSSRRTYFPGVTYHECNILEPPEQRPLLAVAAAEPSTDRCPPPVMNFTTFLGIQSYHGQ